ncbi:MAG: acetyltransferase [Clostridia bacterium]|nr:acetyltransferase [Clostridia bacterium]
MAFKDLVVYGAGGMGRELMWQLNDPTSEKFNILGFIDDDPEMHGKIINGYPVVGDTDLLLERSREICVAVAVGNPSARRRIVEKLKQNVNISFPNIIAPDVKISEFVKLGEGCIICYGNIITVNIEIGDFFISNRCCTVGHDCIIGDYVTLNPMVSISGNVTVESCVDIGTGANIIQGKTIGARSIIGAGAVVIKDIPACSTAVGVPAKPIVK